VVIGVWTVVSGVVVLVGKNAVDWYKRRDPEHPDNLRSRVKQAREIGEIGNAEKARDQLATLVPVVERVQGPEHLDTLTKRASLARWTEKAE
jgi:hypothetical protein